MSGVIMRPRVGAHVTLDGRRYELTSRAPRSGWWGMDLETRRFVRLLGGGKTEWRIAEEPSK